VKIGWIGLGKLGAPCALALNVHGGHEVHGYDRDIRVGAYLAGVNPYPHREEGIQPLLDQNTIVMHHSLGEVVKQVSVVFLAVQTPHAPEYGGETPVPGTTSDFEYGYLGNCTTGHCTW
jgi:UDP-glucose 6-dehydrogenase